MMGGMVSFSSRLSMVNTRPLLPPIMNLPPSGMKAMQLTVVLAWYEWTGWVQTLEAGFRR